MRFEDDFVFAVMRARGDPYRAVVRAPTFAQCRDPIGEITRHLDVELDVADDVDDFLRRAEFDKPLRVFRILRGDPRQSVSIIRVSPAMRL